MVKTDTLTDYDSSASHFDELRKPSHAIVATLRKTFPVSSDLILSIGCGTGRYEKAFRGGKNVVGLDKSEGMISLAKKRVQYCSLGDMANLPFADGMFGGVYFMQSLHHLGANLEITPDERDNARKHALREAIRVLRRGPLMIFQRDPSQNQAVWFWKYFPRALEVKLIIQPRVSTLLKWLKSFGLTNVWATPVHDPMIRGFYDPEAPMDPEFRYSFSEFSYLSENEILQGTEKLRIAVENGTAQRDVEICRQKFAEIGGTVFVVSAVKL